MAWNAAVNRPENRHAPLPPHPFWDWVNSWTPQSGPHPPFGVGVEQAFVAPAHGFTLRPDGFDAWFVPRCFRGRWAGWGRGVPHRHGRSGHGRHHGRQPWVDDLGQAGFGYRRGYERHRHYGGDERDGAAGGNGWNGGNNHEAASETTRASPAALHDKEKGGTGSVEVPDPPEGTAPPNQPYGRRCSFQPHRHRGRPHRGLGGPSAGDGEPHRKPRCHHRHAHYHRRELCYGPLSFFPAPGRPGHRSFVPPPPPGAGGPFDLGGLLSALGDADRPRPYVEQISQQTEMVPPEEMGNHDTANTTAGDNANEQGGEITRAVPAPAHDAGYTSDSSCDILDDWESGVATPDSDVFCSPFSPPVDVFATPTGWTVHAALPGAKKTDVSVSWEESGHLVISGIVHRPSDEQLLNGLVFGERRLGQFERRLALQGEKEVNAERITARMEDGVLVVEVPGKERDWRELNKVDIL